MFHTKASLPTLLAVLLCMVHPPALPAQTDLQARLDSLHALAQVEKDPAQKAELLNRIALRYLNVDTEKTLAYGRQALALAEQHGLEREKARAYNCLASYAIISGDRQQAIADYQKGLDIFERIADEQGVADILGNLGMLYFYMGAYPKSLDYSLRALHKYEALEAKYPMANQSVSIGNVYHEQGDYEQATHYYDVAMRLYQEEGDEDGVALVLGNLANIHSMQGQIKEALEIYRQAIDLYEKIGNPSGVARNLANQSTEYYALGEYANALAAQEKALALFRASNNTIAVCYTTGNMGRSHLLSYKNHSRQDSVFQHIPGPRATLLKEAIRLLQSAVDMGGQLEDLAALSRFTPLLAEAYEHDGDIPKAYRYFKLYARTQDSLRSVEAHSEIERLTTERELALKDKQIELDRLAVAKKRNERLYFGIGIGLLLLSVLFVYRNYANQKHSNLQLTSLNGQLSHTLQDLQATQAQLMEAERQKANALVRSRISQDIHDDISSGLAKITWLAEAFLSKTERAGTDVGPLRKITDQARDTVSKLGEIIWSSNPDRDNLGSLLSYMRRHIRHYMDDAPMRCRVQFPEEVPDLPLSPALRRNLYLVMKEALHNARKYSQAKEIVVSFDLDGPRYRLEVRDDGQGMAPEAAQGGGDGLANMQRRLAAVGGQMQMDTAPGQGVRLIFEGQLDG